MPDAVVTMPNGISLKIGWGTVMGGDNPSTISSLIKGWGLGGGGGNTLVAYSLKMVEALEGMAAMPRWVSFPTNGCGADSGSGDVLTVLNWAYGLGSCKVGSRSSCGKQEQQEWGWCPHWQLPYRAVSSGTSGNWQERKESRATINWRQQWRHIQWWQQLLRNLATGENKKKQWRQHWHW